MINSVRKYFKDLSTKRRKAFISKQVAWLDGEASKLIEGLSRDRKLIDMSGYAIPEERARREVQEMLYLKHELIFELEGRTLPHRIDYRDIDSIYRTLYPTQRRLVSKEDLYYWRDRGYLTTHDLAWAVFSHCNVRLFIDHLMIDVDKIPDKYLVTLWEGFKPGTPLTDLKIIWRIVNTLMGRNRKLVLMEQWVEKMIRMELKLRTESTERDANVLVYKKVLRKVKELAKDG